MARTKVKSYKVQAFDHVRGLTGISDAQIAAAGGRILEIQ